ncbi:hypothetical protein HF576_07100 [Microbacterium sp. CFH 90308]|uniref:PKD domain-containing protein n=1 Tax=Microbacterium salsuginis TaxID=2722803 RepID=A0ABX1K9E3_9MICO|nr:PKD domain-containing protein [Microbacterium sp. CFH 90308]NLP83607.1 hypothetical protein [Microbacterium sp. CFH 90308]
MSTHTKERRGMPGAGRTAAVAVAVSVTGMLMVPAAPATADLQDQPPSVSVTILAGPEGDVSTVRATVSTRGADAVAAEIDWGEAGPPEQVTIARLARGVDHVYGDDGTYSIAVTVTDEDGAVGVEAVPLEVRNLPPEAELAVDGVVEFPGGDYVVTRVDGSVEASVESLDTGSDDATFTWSTGAVAQVFNDGFGPDSPLSPAGTAPFTASGAVTERFATAGVGYLKVSVDDGDGGVTDAVTGVVVTGDADAAHGPAWWTHRFSGAADDPAMDPSTAAAYLDVVAAVSEVFDEHDAAGSLGDAYALLAERAGDAEKRAAAELLAAWLHFASGAVTWDAEIVLDGTPTTFLELMTRAESAFEARSTSDDELRRLVEDLSDVRRSAS